MDLSVDNKHLVSSLLPRRLQSASLTGRQAQSRHQQLALLDISQ